MFFVDGAARSRGATAVPALISAVCVPQLGLYRARQYMLTAEKVPASQLLQEGQLTAVAADLDAAVAHYAAQLLESAPGACKLVKAACHYVAHHDDEQNRAYVRALERGYNGCAVANDQVRL